MGLKLSFELSDRDLLYFRESLQQSREAVRDAEESEIVDAVWHVLEEIRRNEPLPDFVAERLPRLDLLIQMLGAPGEAVEAIERLESLWTSEASGSVFGSSAWQRSYRPNATNGKDRRHFSRAIPRRW